MSNRRGGHRERNRDSSHRAAGDRDRDRDYDRDYDRGLPTAQGGGGGGGSASRRASGRGGERGEIPNSMKSAADIDREARTASERLKEVLAGQSPWSKEVELHRQKARECYMALLFGHPFSTYSQSLEPLWHQTSYLLISSYRAHTARLESELPPLGNRKRQANSSQFVELKKILTRFRQCLSTEESFYRSLISRLVGFYQLQSLTRDQLKVVTIPLADEVPGGGPQEGLAPDMGLEDKREKVGLVYKALVCLGDLERYKEQYDEKTRREVREGRSVAVAKLQERYNRAWSYYEVARGLVPDDGSAFNQLAVISSYLSDGFLCVYYYLRAQAVKHAFKNIHEITEKYMRKAYERGAAEETARRKKSDEGPEVVPKTPVESFRSDLVLVSAILYRRVGLTALPKVQSRMLESFSDLVQTLQLPSEMIVKVTVITIGIHWHARQSASMGSDEAVELRKRRTVTEALALTCLLELASRMFAVATAEIEESLRSRSQDSAIADGAAPPHGQGPGQIAVDEEELHQLISAPLRRMLPSLRILSKWLKLHLDYVNRFQVQAQAQPQPQPQPQSTQLPAMERFWGSYKGMMLKLAMFFPIDHLPSLVDPLEEDIDMKGFIPLSRGMVVTSRSGSGSGPFSGIPTGAADEGTGEESVVGGPVHPNEEQLMRIADLQVDAKLIAQTSSGAMMRGSAESFIPRGGVGLAPAPRDPRDDGDLASVSTETEDDPVNLAMRATLGASSLDEDEHDHDDMGSMDEEIILWGGGRATDTRRPTSYVPPLDGRDAQFPTSARSPPTAQDLLQSLMLESTPSPDLGPPTRLTGAPASGSGSASPANFAQSNAAHPHPLVPGHGPGPGPGPHVPNPNAPQGSPGLLFGGGDGLGSSAASIWTMGRSESNRGNQRTAQGGQGGPAPSHPYTQSEVPPPIGSPSGIQPMDLSSIWTSSTSAPPMGYVSPSAPAVATAGNRTAGIGGGGGGSASLGGQHIDPHSASGVAPTGFGGGGVGDLGPIGTAPRGFGAIGSGSPWKESPRNASGGAPPPHIVGQYFGAGQGQGDLWKSGWPYNGAGGGGPPGSGPGPGPVGAPVTGSAQSPAQAQWTSGYQYPR